MRLSKQSQDLYKILLSSNRPLSAKQLASELGIFHPTVYRLTEPLIAMGLITKTNTYPYQFTAKAVDEGLSLFLLHQNEWFSNQFFTSGKKSIAEKKITKSEETRLSFIQSRDELMNQSAKEATLANKSIDLLRSGHELSADVMLAIIEAKKRNVLTRMLIQDYSKENADQVANWQRNGISVRKTALRHVRLMIYDASVVYFMSYKHTDSKKDMGMKICYPPLAAIFSKVFEQWWQKAEKV